jgi:F0F1-type ATP synthase membrane subunit c/vacuolar-type H+-ATPase subunit K
VNPVLSFVLKAVVVAGLGLVSVLAGSPVVTALFRRADPPPDAAGAAGQPLASDAVAGSTGSAPADPLAPDPDAAPVQPAEDSDATAPGVRQAATALRGGRWIGMLERLAVYASILTGFSEGIAVVLAVKGLARYPELKATTSGTAERFIIGTFASVLFASACAGLAWWLIGLW